MDSIQSILLGRGDQSKQPPEVTVIKEYVLTNFQENVQVQVRDREILITCPSAALAGSLRMHIVKIKAVCSTEKRIVLRIG